MGQIIDNFTGITCQGNVFFLKRQEGSDFLMVWEGFRWQGSTHILLVNNQRNARDKKYTFAC